MSRSCPGCGLYIMDPNEDEENDGPEPAEGSCTGLLGRHRWSKWERVNWNKETPSEYTRQERVCLKCGLKQVKDF